MPWYIAAASSSSRETAESLDSYLYGYAHRAITLSGGDNNGVAALIIIDTAPNSKGAETADYYARYQAGRLMSGLWFAREYPTIKEALADEDFQYIAGVIAKNAGIFNPFSILAAAV